MSPELKKILEDVVKLLDDAHETPILCRGKCDKPYCRVRRVRQSIEAALAKKNP